MTRVLTLTSMYPPHAHGGYERACGDVMERFSQYGDSVTVLATDERRDDVGTDDGDSGSVAVIRALRWYWDDHRLLQPRLVDQIRLERENRATMRRVITEVQPDVISVWSMGAMPLGLLRTVADARVPTVLVVYDDWLVYARRLDPWTSRFENRPRLASAVERVLGVATGPPDLARLGPVLFISETTRRRAEELAGFVPETAAVVPAGIDSDVFRSDPPTCSPPWRGRLLYAGRLDPRKGIDSAIHALQFLPESTTLTIDGSGDPVERKRLDALVDELNLGRRVRFCESTRTELADAYRNADAVLFPSIWDEPFGLVPLEAMACATPVVATGTGGSAEFLRDRENCLLHEPGDAAGLAAAVETLGNDAGLRHRLVERGIDTAARLTVDSTAQALHEWHHAEIALRATESTMGSVG